MIFVKSNKSCKFCFVIIGRIQDYMTFHCKYILIFEKQNTKEHSRSIPVMTSFSAYFQRT